MSALNRRKVSSAMGPTSENEFFRKVPPVRMTSIKLPASSAAILTALVMMVRFWNWRRLAFLHLRHSALRDAHFFLVVKFLFFPQRRIFQRPLARR